MQTIKYQDGTGRKLHHTGEQLLIVTQRGGCALSEGNGGRWYRPITRQDAYGIIRRIRTTTQRS